MTREDLYIAGCMFAINNLIEDGSARYAVKVNGKWETVPWSELLEWLEQEPKTGHKPKTEWIPVTERLPEVGSEVLVCYDFKGKRSVYIADFYKDGKFLGIDDEYLTTEGRKFRKAVAWMPLPEPYKAESEVDDVPVPGQ